MNTIKPDDLKVLIFDLKTKYKDMIDLFKRNKIKCTVEFGYFSMWC